MRSKKRRRKNDSRKKESRETGPTLRLVKHEKVVGFSQPREEISRPGRQHAGMRGLSQVWGEGATGINRKKVYRKVQDLSLSKGVAQGDVTVLGGRGEKMGSLRVERLSGF